MTPFPRAWVMLTALSAGGFDQVVVFGGGWDPTGTQASIEGQTGAVTEALDSHQPVLLFADGSRKTRSVQIPARRGQAERWLALAFDQTALFAVDYRPTRLKPDGPATRAGLFKALRPRPNAHGLAVFGLGHGSPLEGGGARLELWGAGNSVSVDDLHHALRPWGERPVAVVLGQCHSGAFVELSERSNGTRCVFAAVPGDREAAGCTPDVTDPASRAYVHHFAQALKRKARSDLNGDGKVSFSEAHRIASKEDPTLNLPLSSSDSFLLGRMSQIPSKLGLDRLLDEATAADRWFLEQLAAPNWTQVQDARDALEALRARYEASSQAMEAAYQEREQARNQLLDALLLRWPELANPLHPTSRGLLGDPKALFEFLRTSARDPRERLVQADTRWVQVDQELLTLQTQAARIERWLGVADAVWARRQLNPGPNEAAASDHSNLAALDRCEGGSLDVPDP